MMKAEIKAKWVAALRSGDYKQGYGVLRSGDSYCCLGVLCDLAVKEGIITAEMDPGKGYLFEGAVSLPPLSVREWAGIVGVNGILPSVAYDAVGRAYSSLVALNDEAELTFDQIADVIEEKF